MKLSARNQLLGVVCEVRRGVTTAVVKIEVRNPAILTATITLDALVDLKLRVVQETWAVVKASGVILGTAD